MKHIEVWGGVECTVNRVHDRWHDQMALSGHAARADDLDLIAQLGIRTLRYPVLWERTAPNSSSERDWRWADARLAKLQSLDIEPIVGLLHHGSGPHYTNLLAPDFATEFARYAFDVAARYPWVERYTPINEPLTTARFSGLYGLWYPHQRSDLSFARALINQCRGIALSMAAIRRVNPAAQLVQTEDLGTTYSTPHMRYQRTFDNDRRWLSWDLLCGRVNDAHPLRQFLEQAGISAAELNAFVETPCPPQLLGINHYVTSDRYLDERVSRYPSRTHGNNWREQYADVEAVRVLSNEHDGWDIIEATSERYHLPIALTEVHLGCSREEQLRWFGEAWSAAQRARNVGCDVRAVTAWSLFGAFNWDTLLTSTDGTYEPGAFDVRAPSPRRTALADLITQTIGGDTAALDSHLDVAGWWRRPDKVLYGAAAATEAGPVMDSFPNRRPLAPRSLLIVGSSGALGSALVHACSSRNLKCLTPSRKDLDLSSFVSALAACQKMNPWAIVNAAGYVDVDEAELKPARCFGDNLHLTQILAAVAHALHVPFLTFSSDLVFDGQSTVPYVESCVAAPLNVYGHSKLAAEHAALQFPQSLCVRSAAFFGAWQRRDFLADALIALSSGRHFTALDDVTVSPTYLPDLARISLDLLIDKHSGLLHLVSRGAVTWADFAAQGAAALKIDSGRLVRRSLNTAAQRAARPHYSALASEHIFSMPPLADAIHRYALDARQSLAGMMPLRTGSA